ncbi:MAG TPA: hypothetical protein VJJ83_04160, partial [Candidatus Babeliales bacterium]|nr:hypothetical protein [Candidatus Babeliales bacterium]
SRLAADDIRDLAAVANEESRGMGGDPERVDRHQEALKRLMAEQCGYPGEPEKLFTGPQQTELKKLKTPERAKRIYLKLRHDSAAHKNVQDAIRLETERPTGLQIGRFWVPDLEHIATRHLGRAGEPKISTRVELKTLGPDAKLKPGQKVGDVVAESQPATLFSWNKYKGEPSKVLAVLNRAKPVGELYNADKNSYQQLLIDEDGEPLQTLELAPGLDPRATPFRLLTTVYPYISLTRFETTGGSEKHAVLFNPDLVISSDKAQNLKRQIELSGAEVTAMARRALEKYDRNPKRVTNPLKFHGLDGQSDIFDISSELETNSRLKAAGIAVPEMSV